MKVSDYLISRLQGFGVKDVFLLSGGGMMHMLDSLAKNNNINKYYNLNEQATSFCADAYAQTTNTLGVCFVTTGPGATNAITGVASAHIDSTPLLVISGQVRTDAMVGDKKVRQYGAQEIGIIPIVESITKYAVTIMKAEEIRYHLEKAIYLATHGRKGAVWLDVPLDVQGAQIAPDSLKAFDPVAENLEPAGHVSDEDIHAVYELLKTAKRPVLLVGYGVIQAGAWRALMDFVRKIGVPVLSSYRAKGLLASNLDVNFFGCPSAIAPRYTNYILQNSDALLSIGCGLGYNLTVFNERNFAFGARKIINNIDPFEISKLDMKIEKAIVCDAGELLSKLMDDLRFSALPDWIEWMDYCNNMRDKYPPQKEGESAVLSNAVDGYTLSQSLWRYSSNSDVIVASMTTYMGDYLCVPYIPKKGQLFVITLGLGAMGSGLPNAVAACIASGKKRTILFEGDGSLQHNIQELALIKTYGLPIKVIVESNGGYLQIKNMQNRHFEGRLAGCDSESGVRFPNLSEIAKAYGLRYEMIKNNNELDDKMNQILMDNEPFLVEVVGSQKPRVLPIVQSRILADGKMATASMEDMFPFLSEEEHAENMRISSNERNIQHIT